MFSPSLSLSLKIRKDHRFGVYFTLSLPFIILVKKPKLSLSLPLSQSSAHPFTLQLPRPGRAVARPVDQEADVAPPATAVGRGGVLRVLPKHARRRGLDVARGEAPAGDADDNVPRRERAVVGPRGEGLGVLPVVDDPGPAAGPAGHGRPLHEVQHRLARRRLGAGDVVPEGRRGRDLERVPVLEGDGVPELGDHDRGKRAEDGLEGGGADARGRRGGGHAPARIKFFFFFFPRCL